jgi:hypothetical protein
VFQPGPFGYPSDITFDVAGKPAWRRLATRAAFTAKALRTYDVIHFNFGHSLMTLHAAGRVLNELPLIRHAGITILVTFQGCDVRPQSRCPCTQEHCRRDDPYRPANAARFLRYADRCFHLNPDLREWLPGSRFLPYASVDIAALAPPPMVRQREVVRIAHAPTNRAGKGSAHVIAAVDGMRAEGIAVELDLIEGVLRDEVLARVREADIVVDSLLGGWYGGFAVESMALARPVLCDIREATPDDNPFGAELPIVRATPDTLEGRLRELVSDPERCVQLGAAGRSFVERHHDPRAVARQALEGIVSIP